MAHCEKAKGLCKNYGGNNTTKVREPYFLLSLELGSLVLHTISKQANSEEHL